jgi:hypothetical protein
MLVVCQAGCSVIVHWWKVWSHFIVYPFFKTASSFGHGNSVLHTPPFVSVFHRGRAPCLMAGLGISSINNLSCALRDLVVIRHATTELEDLYS